MMGIEAGQSAVGDLFNWGVRVLGSGGHETLQREAEGLRPGESGLLALDWNNGNRTILVDPLLSGLLIGQSLHTTAAEVYRALIEGTAFGALTIIRRIEESGVRIDEVVVCGGIAEKSPLTMQIYADVCNRPMKVAASGQTCALGAAIFGAVVGGAYADTRAAQAAMVAPPKTTYVPSPLAAAVYADLYELYMQLHDAFGAPPLSERSDGVSSLSNVMKALLAIRERSRLD
jgi:L-ribulokinase